MLSLPFKPSIIACLKKQSQFKHPIRSSQYSYGPDANGAIDEIAIPTHIGLRLTAPSHVI